MLADVFENFINNRLKNYGLCWSHYMRALALIWDPMLNMRKVELQFISDPHMYLFFEKGMRGGVSYVSKGNNKSKNNYLIFYDQKQESKHIIYLDTNHLCGYAMSKFLPTSGFKWIYPKHLTWMNTTAIVQKIVFSKLILSILKSHGNCTIIINGL